MFAFASIKLRCHVEKFVCNALLPNQQFHKFYNAIVIVKIESITAYH